MDKAVVTVAVSADSSSLALTALAEGTATLTVTAEAPGGERVAETFEATVNPAPQPETPKPGHSEVAARYDADSNGKIDLSEYRRALNDYIARTISYTELLGVVTAYQTP